MKRVGLIFCVALLFFSEVYLCSAFLPMKWQIAIHNTVARLLPHKQSQWDTTHPALDYEVQQFLKENPPLRLAAYGALLLLTVLNTFFLVACWKILRGLKRNQHQGLQQPGP